MKYGAQYLINLLLWCLRKSQNGHACSASFWGSCMTVVPSFSVKHTETSRMSLFTLICKDGWKVFKAMAASGWDFCGPSKAFTFLISMRCIFSVGPFITGALGSDFYFYFSIPCSSELHCQNVLSRKCSLMKIRKFFFFKANHQHF